MAVEHARSTYGEPNTGLTPGMIYNRPNAVEALSKARRAREIVIRILGLLNIAI